MAETAEPETLVEAALEQLLSWPGLSRSPQLARFLDYIVRARLRGDEGSIKAYAIAVDVFGRPQSFDPQADPIVRVQARRLRAALDEYYAGEGAGDPVRIHLPVGRYVPEFQFRGEAPAGVVPPEPVRESPPRPEVRLARPTRAGLSEWMLYVIVLFIGAGIIVALVQVLMPRPTRIEVPGPPTVGIAEFTAIASADWEGQAARSIAGLAIELVTDLQLFDDILPDYVQPDSRDEDGPDYQLTGIARQESGQVRVTASLRRSDSDAALWTFTQSVDADELDTSIDELSRAFAEQLGSHRGPLFAEANKWLDEHPNISGNETVFLCGLLFTRYRDNRDLDEEARARDCASAVLARGEDPLALAIRAGLLLDDTVATQPLAFDPEPLAETGRLLGQALKLDATSSTIWREQARYLNRLGRVGESEAAYASALQLNPANLDARAGYGRMLSGRGNSPHGKALASEALQRALLPPHWYYAAPAMNALRDNDDASAITYADRLASGDPELAALIATVAAFRSGNEDALNRYFAQLLDVTRFRRFGILPVLRQRIPDPALVDLIATQLTRAGVADEALNGSF